MRIVVTLLSAAALAGAAPVFESQLIFPLEHWHNHSSSIVELANGDLFVCWYHGSGERTADDVKVEAARRKYGTRQWQPRYTLADTPNFPDTNPILFVDRQARLWLMWPVIIANRWETALLQYRIAGRGGQTDPPRWEVSESLLFIPPNFAARVRAWVEPMRTDPALPAQVRQWASRVWEKAADKYFSRMGWMPRAHPLELPSGRILTPLYSDGYDFSLIAITDDGGRTWTASEPLLSYGGVQPSLVRKRNGEIVAYLRDNGPPPKRVIMAVSKDEGVTWTPGVDTDIPNSGTSVEVIALRDGQWLMVNNDTEQGRHALSAWLSDDEGATWKWKRRIEWDRREKGAGSFHYPSVIQGRDGMIHLTYSYFLNHLPKDAPRKSIKYARFNAEWVRAGDGP